MTQLKILTITSLFTTSLAQYGNYRSAADPNQPAILIGKNDHKVTMEDSLSTDQIEFIRNIMEERKSIEMGRDLGELVRMAFWYAVLNRKAGFEFAHDVPLEEAMSFFSSNITGHGCYCWPDGKERINGFGPRKDALDEVCFSLYNCYRCVNMQNGCGTTDWVTFAYGCAFADEDQDGQIELKCTDSPGSCGRL